MVVVAEYGNGRNADTVELLDEDARLGDGPDAGEVACDEQHVGALGEPLEVRAEGSARVLAEVHVAHGGDADHVSCSPPWPSTGCTTPISSWTR